MDDNFSPRVKDVISYSKEEALRLGHNSIGTEHLMLGILRDGSGKAVSILKSIEVDLDELRRKVEILNPAVIENSETINNKKNLHLTRQAERALKTTFLEAKLFQSDIINTAHMWVKQKRDFSLAIGIKTWGSSPRQVGIMMLIRGDGHLVGSVSGGWVEGAVVISAKNTLESSTAEILDFGVADQDAWFVRLSYGVKISAFICPRKKLG